MNTKNELLYVDRAALMEQKQKMEAAAILLNRFKDAALKELSKLDGYQLDKEQLENLMKKSAGHVEDEVRKRFPYPHADEEFNLRAMGINLSEIKKHSTTSWSGYRFYIDPENDNPYSPADEQPALAACYHYADTEIKQKALEIAEKTVELFKEADDAGTLLHGYLNGVSNALGGIVSVTNSGRGNCLEVDRKRISQITERTFNRTRNPV
jgi:hypothetical protein